MVNAVLEMNTGCEMKMLERRKESQEVWGQEKHLGGDIYLTLKE